MPLAAPRILYITPCWPHGKAYGGQLRALQIGRALQQCGEVSLAVVSSDLPEPEALEQTRSEFKLEAPVRVLHSPNRSLTQRLRWAFDTRYLNVHGCVADDRDRARIMDQLSAFDLVWVLNSRTPNILNRWDWPGSVLDLDDVPSTFQRTVWQKGATLGQRLKAGLQMNLLRRRERRWRERFTVLSVCSEADRQYLGASPHVHVIPNGFEQPRQTPSPTPLDPPRIGFIGLFSYLPNAEGVSWFVRECWPALRTQFPGIRFRLAGKDTDGPLRPTGSDIDALGWIADPAAEIATWSAMIIPVRQGAGTRVKIADAFSRKCPVVSTPLGAYGYDVKNQRELLLAESPAEFIAACSAHLRDRNAAAAMAERAYQAFLTNWTWEAITPRVKRAAQEALGKARSQTGASAPLQSVN